MIQASKINGIPIVNTVLTGLTYVDSLLTAYNSDGTSPFVTIVAGSSFTGGTVTGATIFTSSLSANTISATTYYNIPTVFGVCVNGAGGTIISGATQYLVMGNNGRITGWDVIGATSGSCKFNIWKTTGSTLPTSANSITPSNRPQIANGVYSGSTNVSNWTDTTYNTGDKFGFNIDEVSGFTQLTLTIRGFKDR